MSFIDHDDSFVRPYDPQSAPRPALLEPEKPEIRVNPQDPSRAVMRNSVGWSFVKLTHAGMPCGGTDGLLSEAPEGWLPLTDLPRKAGGHVDYESLRREATTPQSAPRPAPLPLTPRQLQDEVILSTDFDIPLDRMGRECRKLAGRAFERNQDEAAKQLRTLALQLEKLHGELS